MKTSAFLKSKIDKKGQSPIFIRVFKDGKYKTYSTNLRIEPKFWNSEKEKVKSSADNADEINATIKKQLAELSKTALTDELFKITSIPTSKTFYSGLDELIKIRSKSVEFSSAYVKQFQTLKNSLEEYYPELSFNQIDKNWYEDWLSKMHKQELQPNTVGTRVKNLKTYLGWAADKGYHNNFKYIRFAKTFTDADLFAFTYDEVRKIIAYNPADEIEAKCLLIFIIGVNTGLRYSDIMRLSKGDLILDEHDNSYIIITQHKTLDKVQIPLSEQLYELFTSKGFTFSSFQDVGLKEFNVVFKEMCRKIKLNRIVKKKKIVGKVQTSEDLYLWSIVSSHMMRRTFITLAILNKVSHQLVMQVSGHRSYTAFKKYVKVSEDPALRQVIEVFNRMDDLDETDLEIQQLKKMLIEGKEVQKPSDEFKPKKGGSGRFK